MFFSMKLSKRSERGATAVEYAVLAALLAFTLVLPAASAESNQADAYSATADKLGDADPGVLVEPVPPATSAAPTETPTEAPATSAAPTETPTEAPATSAAPTETPTEVVAPVFLWAFGDGSSGGLGNNSTANSSAPVSVYTAGALAGKTVTAVSAGNWHSCALASGQVYCWGDNAYGQLGNGATTDSYVPVAVNTSGVLSGKTVTAISSGYEHSCALADGKVYCWGYNISGQLGNNSTTTSLVPVAVNTSGVLSGKTVTQIVAGNWHTCAIAGGAAYCWGHNNHGRLGNNSTTNSSVPVAVVTSGVLSGKTVTSISAGFNYTCAVASGNAYCWGNNVYGQLGNNSTTNSSVPVAVVTSGVLSGKTVTSISGYYYHSCALAAGKVYCWGYNADGQLGNNSTANALVPVAVNTSGVLSGKTVTAISAGWYHTCGLASGAAFCWGDNGFGELGNNSTADSLVPVAVYTGGLLSGKTITMISAGAGKTHLG